MSKSKYDKDINENLLYNSNQICLLIKYVFERFSENITKESLENAALLGTAFQHSNHKLHPVFGNNIARTNFPLICNKLLEAHLTGCEDDLLKKMIFIITSLLWNLTDCSELFCKEMIASEGFKRNIVQVLMSTEYDEVHQHHVESALSIVNNIVRRPSLRHSFDEFDLCDKVSELEKSPIMSRDLRIICVAIVFYLVSALKLKSVAPLADEVRDDVIEILDGCTNSADLQAEGFRARELLELLTILCRDVTTQREAARSQTLSLSLQRLLTNGSHPAEVATLARAMFTETQFAAFRQAYEDKNGTSNTVVLDHLKWL